MKMTTPHAATVREAFLEYAKMMDVYASDQKASLRWHRKATERADVMARAVVYEGIAAEIRTMEFVEEITS